MAGRFAADDRSALALDLLSNKGGTGAFPGEAEVAAALAAVDRERFDADMQDALAELRRRVPHGGLAAIGFCFGGGMVWRLRATGDERLDAAAPYGPFPANASLDGARTAPSARSPTRVAPGRPRRSKTHRNLVNRTGRSAPDRLRSLVP